VHPVGFIIRIYHDARSPECQINLTQCSKRLYFNSPQLLVNYGMYAILNALLSYIFVTVRVTGSRELCNEPNIITLFQY